MYPSIATTVLPRIEESIWFKFVLAFVGSVLLAVSAKVQIPFWPVPMTMQTFVVLVIGMAYGAQVNCVEFPQLIDCSLRQDLAGFQIAFTSVVERREFVAEVVDFADRPKHFQRLVRLVTAREQQRNRSGQTK